MGSGSGSGADGPRTCGVAHSLGAVLGRAASRYAAAVDGECAFPRTRFAHLADDAVSVRAYRYSDGAGVAAVAAKRRSLRAGLHRDSEPAAVTVSDVELRVEHANHVRARLPDRYRFLSLP